MAGLLDFLETPAGQGLLAATFAGLAGARRGAPMNTLGAAGLGGLAGYSNALNMNQDRQRQDIQNKMLNMQMQQLERARADEEAQQQAFKLMTQARQTKPVMGLPTYGQPGEGMPALFQGAPIGGDIGMQGKSFDIGVTPGEVTMQPNMEAMRQLQENPYYQKMFATSQMKQMFAEPDYKVVGNSLVQVGPGGAKSVFDAPQEQKQTELARLIAERDSLPPGHPAMATYDSAIRKASTHQQPFNISLGGPQAVINPVTGQPELAQFPNKPGATPVFTGLKPAPEAGKPPTEGETKAAFYVQNMKAASKTLSDLEKKGFDPTKTGEQISTAVAGGIGNILVNKMAQQAKQAQDQWSEQMLRMQTGAAATADEIARTRRTYFPVTGDSADTVELKRQMREQAESGVYSAAGRAQGRVPSGATGGWSIKKVP